MKHPTTIHVVSLSDRAELSDLTWPSVVEFCRARGLPYTLRPRLFPGIDRAASWQKLLLVKAVMEADPTADVVLWVDDDVIVTNPDADVGGMLAGFLADPHALLAACEDTQGEPFNMGVVAFRNCSATTRLIDELWAGCSDAERHKPLWEQTCMHRLMREGRVPSRTVHVLPPRTLQSFLRDYDDPPTFQWRFGDFAAHLTGMSLPARLERARFLVHHRETGVRDDVGLERLLQRRWTM